MKVNPKNTYWFNKSMYEYHDGRITSLEKKVQKHKTKRAHYNAVLSDNVEWMERWQEHVQEVIVEQAQERNEKQKQLAAAEAKLVASEATRQLQDQVAKAEEVKVVVTKRPAQKNKKPATRKPATAKVSS